MAYFAMTTEQGPAWIDSRSMRDQEKWTEHAGFINSLVDEGVVIIAGPLDDGPKHRALLIVNSVGESAVRARFAEDPWIRTGVLRILQIDLWKVLASDERLDRVLADITKAGPPA